MKPQPKSNSVRVSPRMERFLLGMTCFFSGGAILIIELAGNRLLAPVFGNSLYTWTGLISIILLAISTGDYLGGWMVDRNPRFVLIRRVLFAAAGFVFLIPVIIPELAHQAEKWSLLWGPLLASVILFAVPAILLATVTPMAIRLLSRTMADQHIGISAGTIGMLASLGSFSGTLLTGFVLIPMIGVTELYWVVGGLLVALGLVHAILLRDGKHDAVFVVSVVFCVGAAVATFFAEKNGIPNAVFQKDDFYHRITVLENMPGRQGERTLVLDNTLEGSQTIRDGDVTFSYQKYWRLSEAFFEHIHRAVFFGAGAFTMPEQLSKRFPEATVDVVEIDPEVINVGRKFFKLNDFPKVVPQAMDARRFLRGEPDGSYDFIFGDAYHGTQYVPAHLLTREFFQLVDRKLAPDGIYAMNFIGAFEGRKSELFLHVLATLRSVFPEIQVYPDYPYSPEVPQNLIIVASQKSLSYRPELSQELNALLHAKMKTLPSTEGIGMLSDNYCPVEYLIAKQIR
ncbi:MAG: fused MFS/spermidine synthase [Chthoniobacterales bacterium]